MYCPACKSPSFETAVECGECGLSLERADSLFGAPPAIPSTVADLAGVLSASGRRTVRSAAVKLQSKFPQVRFTSLTVAVAPDVSLPVYTFWIFNRGGVCREIERGSANHNILLVVDPENARSNLIIGYGLEPFLSTDKLDAALEAAAPAFANTDYSTGIKAAIASLSASLATISLELPTTYGLNPNEIAPKTSTPAEF